MKAIILAAGRGTRMGSLTDEGPKCLTLLSGQPLLSWQVKALKDAGVQEIGIVRGYKKDKIKIEGAFYFENPKWNKTNMVRSLEYAREWLEKETCVVSYSDIIYPAGTIVQLLESRGDIVISYNTEWLEIWEARFDDPLTDAETFRINEKGVVVDIGNKANRLEEIQGQYMGLIKFTSSGWSDATDILSSLRPDICDHMDMTTFLQELIKAGISIDAIPIKGRWFEFDCENDLRAYQRISHKMNIL